MPPTKFSESHYELNIQKFIRFRLFYNARFYYPVFTVLFLDYGLTLEEFAILNMVWSITIICAEIPSGAFADIFGRKRLLVFAALLMLVEMALIAFFPLGHSPFLFIVFLINRICSGLSEAAVSGADEALAFDSLKAMGRENEWPSVLARLTRASSLMFFWVMIIGGLVYDHSFVNGCLAFIDPSWVLPKEAVIRIPIFLSLISSVFAVYTALSFVECNVGERRSAVETGLISRLEQPFKNILIAGKWAFQNKAVLLIIIATLILDSAARQFVVLSSEYWRALQIPAAGFGFIGAGMAMLGFINAQLSEKMVTHYRPVHNFWIMISILFLGLMGVCLSRSLVGVLFAAISYLMLGMIQFQSSHYINRLVDSEHRATLLSFKGLAINLGLGFVSLVYTFYIAWIRTLADGTLEVAEKESLQFIRSLTLLPIYLGLLTLIFSLYARNLGQGSNLSMLKESTLK